MWLLVAIGIGILLLCRLGIDTSRTNAVRGRKESLEQEYMHFCVEYGATLEQENEIKQRYMTGRDTEILDLKQELKQFIEWEPTYGMIVVGMLAKQGKVPSTSSMYFDTYQLFNWPCEVAAKEKDIPDVPNRRRARFRFLHWYDETLREHGLPYDLLYIITHEKQSGMDIYNIEQAQAYKLYYPSKTEMMTVPTIFLWYPTRGNNKNMIIGML